MKNMTFSWVLTTISVMAGVLVAWNACLVQDADIGTKVGSVTYCCHQDPCEQGSVNCEDGPGGSCSHSEACCRAGAGGEYGACNDMPGNDCVVAGCQARSREMCS